MLKINLKMGDLNKRIWQDLLLFYSLSLCVVQNILAGTSLSAFVVTLDMV
jgi:hypothetical protein